MVFNKLDLLSIIHPARCSGGGAALSFVMTPEQLAGFASNVSTFAAGQIDQLYQVLLRLQETALPVTPTSIVEEWRSLDPEGHTIDFDADNESLQWILDLLEVDPEIPLVDKFLDVLEAANIVLTTSSSLPPPPSERPSTPDSVESIDENDPLWLQAVALDNRKLASQALDQWRSKLQEQREAYEDFENPALNHVADQFYRANLARKATAHWHARTQEIQEMEHVADEFRKRKDAAYVLKIWTLATREKIFVRVRDERLAHKALSNWYRKTEGMREMQATAEDFRNRQALRSVFEKMARRTTRLREAESRAVVVYEGNLARKTLEKWLATLQEVQINEQRADAAADYFASKHALHKWREKTQIRLEEKEAIEARKKDLQVQYFRRWRTAVKKKKEAKYNDAYKKMRRKVKVNIARTALTIWRDKTRQIREMNATADDFRERKDADGAKRAAHTVIVAMFTTTENVQQANREADRFFNKTLLHRLQVFGSNWLAPTRQILANQERADEYRATRTASHAVAALRSWRNSAFRAKRLQDDADALRLRNEKKHTLGVLNKWRQRASVSAIAASNGREDENGGGGPGGAGAVEPSFLITMMPTTPAARRSQLLAGASTTPAYTPATALFGGGRRDLLHLEEQAEEDEGDDEEDEGEGGS